MVLESSGKCAGFGHILTNHSRKVAVIPCWCSLLFTECVRGLGRNIAGGSAVSILLLKLKNSPRISAGS